MNRFKRLFVIAFAVLLGLMSIAVFADSYYLHNSFQTISYGYSNGGHFTSYSMRDLVSATMTKVPGYGVNIAISANPGQTATSKVYSPLDVSHTHAYGQADVILD